MKKGFRHSALALAVSSVCSVSFAASHPESFGAYRTAVQEDRLFIEDGTVLRCDLYFSSAQRDDDSVAHRGSRVTQTVPPFVWQFSGLLPVSDYLKTVAIHSAGSKEKERAWQDVQLTFYEGLRVEGAREFEAKIAYAGAYAFAPRWPLVELIDISDSARDIDSRAYRVEYIAASPKGVTIDEYRSLVVDIEANAPDISLQDIRGVIDAADAARVSSAEDDSWLKRIWRNESPGDKKKKAAVMTDEKTPAAIGTEVSQLFATEETQTADGSQQSTAAVDVQNAVEPGANVDGSDPVATSMAEDTADQSMDGDILAEQGVVVEIPEPIAGVDNEIFAEPEAATGPQVTIDEEIPIKIMLEDRDLEMHSDNDINMSGKDELKLINDGVSEMESGEPVVIDDSMLDDDSVSDQLAAADKQVLAGGDTTAEETQEGSPQVDGVVVDLDSLFADEVQGAEPDKTAEPPVPEVERRDDEPETWEVLPDGSELLKF